MITRRKTLYLGLVVMSVGSLGLSSCIIKIEPVTHHVKVSTDILKPTDSIAQTLAKIEELSALKLPSEGLQEVWYYEIPGFSGREFLMRVDCTLEFQDVFRSVNEITVADPKDEGQARDFKYWVGRYDSLPAWWLNAPTSSTYAYRQLPPWKEFIFCYWSNKDVSHILLVGLAS